MRFALKTLVLAMMVMMIASVAMAQNDFKPTLKLYGMVRADIAVASVKNDDVDTSKNEDASWIKLARLQLGFLVKPSADVTFQGEIRVTARDEDTTTDSTGNGFSNPYKIGIGDSYGEWYMFGGPVFIKAGAWWNDVGGGWDMSLYSSPWGLTMIDGARVGQVEVGAKFLFMKVGLGVFSPAGDNTSASLENDINDMYAYIRASPKLGPVQLGINLGFKTHVSEGYLDGTGNGVNGVNGASEKNMGMSAEIYASAMGIHFLGTSYFRLGDVQNVVYALGFELGYNLAKVGYFGLKFDHAGVDTAETAGSYTYSPTQIGLTVAVNPAANTTVGFEALYGMSNRKAFIFAARFQWAFGKVLDL